MLTILHPFEELGQRFGRYKEKQQAFREDQPSDQGDYHWQRPARPDIVPKYHRETGCEADYCVDEHDGPIGNQRWLHNFGRCDEWNLCLIARTVVRANQERR